MPDVVNDPVIIEVTVTNVRGEKGDQGIPGPPGDLSDDVITGLDAKHQPIWSMTDRTIAFIEDMLKPFVRGTTDCKIEPDTTWPADWTGPTTGKFSMILDDEDSAQLCPLIFGVPNQPLSPSYRGMLFGGITVPPTADMVVQAYKKGDVWYAFGTPAVVDSGSGNWGLDLSTVPDYESGEWAFALIDDGDQVGEKGPLPLCYEDIRVEARVVTDTTYEVGSVPARTDHRFEFLSNLPGRKQYRLVRTSNDEILADYTPTVGPVRSYLVGEGEPGYGTGFVHQSYCYDQAMALMAMIAIGRYDLAKQLAQGLLLFQQLTGANAGGFRFSGQQLSPTYGDEVYRTGAHCFCIEALARYIEACPSDTTRDYVTALENSLAWLMDQLGTDGLFLGGSGTYDPEGAFDPSADLTWASSEHNFDAYHALVKCAQVLDDPDWLDVADALKLYIMEWLWNEGLQRFNQGLKHDQVADVADPLDCHSWGAMFLMAIGETERANIIMSDVALEPFKHTVTGPDGTDWTGYSPAYPEDPEYPSANYTVWSEGSAGVALAFLAIGAEAKWLVTMRNLAHTQDVDGAYRYCWPKNVIYEWTDSKTVIGGSWAILAAAGRGIWGMNLS